ncbi:hypothetical protein BJX61DRAFT_544026 [Aspergillus egyptiacus]|nr:hypothetical protein BJX61DRAFT_544026 [Aspergillus egyptiacus]
MASSLAPKPPPPLEKSPSPMDPTKTIPRSSVESPPEQRNVVPGETPAATSGASSSMAAAPRAQDMTGGPQPPAVPEKIPLDLSSLAGLEVAEGGKILDGQGRAIGRVVEGDPEDLIGQIVDGNGDILDEDGDLIGRVELIPSEMLRGAAAPAPAPVSAPASIPPPHMKGELPLSGDARTLEKMPMPMPIPMGVPTTGDGKIMDEAGRVFGQAMVGKLNGLGGRIPNEPAEAVHTAGGTVGGMDLDSEVIEESLEGDEMNVNLPGVELPDISTLQGMTCNQLGQIVTKDGVAVGELVEGDPKRICRDGFQLDDQGRFWDYRGNVVGKARPVVLEEEEGRGPFADYGDIFIGQDGFVLDDGGKRVGRLVDGDAAALIGYAVDDDGDIIDKRGNVIGHVEPCEEPEPVDFSVVEGLKPNKHGYVMGPEQIPIARLAEGNWEELKGRPIDNDGLIRNESGEVIGQVELIPENELRTMGPFTGLGDLVATASGLVEDSDGVVVGKIAEGDRETLRGQTVNESGDVVDQDGNVLGRAERYELAEADLSVLEGMRVNKLGNVVDENGVFFGRIVAGCVRKLAGKAVDGEGQVWSDADKVIGQAELIPEKEREPREAPFSGIKGLIVGEDGMIVDPSGQAVGRLVEGDKQHLVKRAVDEDGEITDKFGKVIGRAERWTPGTDEGDVNQIPGGGLELKDQEKEEPQPSGESALEHPQEQTGKRVNDDVVPEKEGVAEPVHTPAMENPPEQTEETADDTAAVPAKKAGESIEKQEVEGPRDQIGERTGDEAGIPEKEEAGQPIEKPAQEKPQDQMETGKSIDGGQSLHEEALEKAPEEVPEETPKEVPKEAEEEVSEKPAEIPAEKAPKEGPGKAVEEVPEKRAENLTEAPMGVPQTAPGEVSEKSPKEALEEAVEEASEKPSEKMPAKVPEKVPEGVAEKAPETIPERMPEKTSQEVPGKPTEDIAQEVPEKASGQAPEQEANKIAQGPTLEGFVSEPEQATEQLEGGKEMTKEEKDARLEQEMCSILKLTQDAVAPLCEQITEYIDKADNTPKANLDEEALVQQIKPLIEKAGTTLQECKTALRSLDPNGHIAATAEALSSMAEDADVKNEVASLLKELTQTVAGTIDTGRRLIEEMPLVKRKINPLWPLLSEPLIQIIAAVGLLVSGVIDLLSKLLDGLGLGGIFRSLLGGLGVDKDFTIVS